MKLLSLAVFLTYLSGNAAADPKAVHGMLVFGQAQTYLSHLPMFHPPHDYQWVMEVEFPASVHRQKVLECETLCTLVPEPFSLPVVAGKKANFKAVLFKGHFERGGTPISGEFLVTIKHNLVFKKLEGEFSLNSFYYAIGNEKEKFLVHSIGGEGPDFDQVVQVANPEKVLTFLKEGLAPFVKAKDKQPLKLGSFVINKGTSTEETLQIAKEVYLEEDELSH